MGVEQKRGDTKIFKRGGGGKLGQGVGVLKRGEDWNTLTNYDSDINFISRLMEKIAVASRVSNYFRTFQ